MQICDYGLYVWGGEFHAGQKGKRIMIKKRLVDSRIISLSVKDFCRGRADVICFFHNGLEFFNMFASNIWNHPDVPEITIRVFKSGQKNSSSKESKEKQVCLLPESNLVRGVFEFIVKSHIASSRAEQEIKEFLNET